MKSEGLGRNRRKSSNRANILNLEKLYSRDLADLGVGEELFISQTRKFVLSWSIFGEVFALDCEHPSPVFVPVLYKVLEMDAEWERCLL